MSEDTILFAKLKGDAKIPSKSKENAGYDIYPCFEEDGLVILPGETKLVPTGIGSVIPEGYYMQIQERGSSGSKGIKYSAGVIDSSYRGEWFLATTNTNNVPVVILRKGCVSDLESYIDGVLKDALIIYPYEKALFQAVLHSVHNEIGVKEISKCKFATFKSERGDGKLGSSGK